MAATSSRTLRLLSLLQGRRSWPGDQLADRLEVSVRTLRRDVERLRELGYPVQARPGLSGGYQLAPGASLPPLVLDDEEAVALAVGLQAAAQSDVAGMAEASVRALTKVAQVMPAHLRRRVEALRAMTVTGPAGERPGPGIDPAVLTTMAQACRDTERVGFGYRAASGEVTERLVEPYRLVPVARRWYLVAYDLGRHDWRVFRLDRVDRPVGTGVPFRPRELGTDAGAYVRERIEHGAEPYDIEVIVQAAAVDVSRQVGRWARVEPLSEGRCRLRMRVDALEWAALALGSTGAELTVVRPPELRTLLQDWAGRFARS